MGALRSCKGQVSLELIVFLGISAALFAFSALYGLRSFTLAENRLQEVLIEKSLSDLCISIESLPRGSETYLEISLPEDTVFTVSNHNGWRMEATLGNFSYQKTVSRKPVFVPVDIMETQGKQRLLLHSDGSAVVIKRVE